MLSVRFTLHGIVANDTMSLCVLFQERVEDGQTTRQKGMMRKKNRDAARKSRKRQTERADELHEVVITDSVVCFILFS